VAAEDDERTRADPEAELRLRRLLPSAGETTVAAYIEEIGLWERSGLPAGRPRVLLNMVSSADGRATLRERSAPLSGAADRALFHGLRTAVDGVLVGAGTVRSERYGPLIGDPARRRLRARRGLSEVPVACIVTATLALDPDIPLLAEPGGRVVILTTSERELPPLPASVSYVRAGGEGGLDLADALRELRERHGVATLLCEGGPHLAGALVRSGTVDELFLTLSPLLAGGPDEALRIIAGEALRPPRALELRSALEHGSQLFLRYGIGAPDRVSRETTPSSSPAR
jgi:riboflavin biosynthesis pyrimidine reductase